MTNTSLQLKKDKQNRKTQYKVMELQKRNTVELVQSKGSVLFLKLLKNNVKLIAK